MDFAQTLAELNLDAKATSWVSEQLEIAKKAVAALALSEAKYAESEAKYIKAEAELRNAHLKNQALVLELAHLRRMRFGVRSEAISQASYDLFDETAGADIAAIEAQLKDLASAAQDSNNVAQASVAKRQGAGRQGAGRQGLPAHLPRIEHRHEIERCDCATCGGLLSLIGEDVSEQLDVEPARFFVHRHIRPQYACKACETVTAAPVPAAVIDGGMAAPGLISWVLNSKFADHLPLYRLEQIAARSGLNLARSTLAEWVGRYGVALSPLVDRLRVLLLQRAVLHADETPVEQLAPGHGKTKRAYLWAYCSSELGASETQIEAGRQTKRPPPIVVFDYQSSRAGAHARAFLAHWRGQLMCDDYVGYKALFETHPEVIELGCMAHARRKFFDLHAANGSPVAFEALQRIAALYEIESRVKAMSPEARKHTRMAEAAPKLDAFKAWLLHTRTTTANGGALAKAIDYTLRRYAALSRYAQSADLPIDNNPIENAIRPIAIGKKNWLFAGSQRAGERAAAIQSLIATAKRNGIDPAKWLTDVITKLPTHPNRRIDELLPFRGYRFGD